MITIGVGDEIVGSFLFHNYSLWKIMKISLGSMVLIYQFLLEK